MVKAAAVYTRISQDDGTALGVARQRDDCEREAERRGWPIAEVFTDNDVSATRSKTRPAYQRMLEAVRSGQIDALIVWDVDRLTRTPAELESFIDLADRHGLSLASIGGEIDLATPQGRLTARIKGSVARHEVEQMSRRLRRKFEESRSAGKPHGSAPFGYRREDGNDVLHPAEAEAVRECYRRVMAGDSLRGIAAYLNSAGFKTSAGNAWLGHSVGRMLRRPHYIGRVTHKGQDVGPGTWEAIVDPDTFDRVHAILTDPKRRVSRGRELKYLGSGLYKCGLCSGIMRPVVSTSRPVAYACKSCTRISRRVEPVDQVVEAVIVARLGRPDILSHLAEDSTALEGAIVARDAVLARMDSTADMLASGELTARQFSRINDRLRADLAAAEESVKANRGRSLLYGMTGERAAEAWAAASLERRREILRELADVVILPSRTGIKFDPEQVRFDWKTEPESDTPMDIHALS